MRHLECRSRNHFLGAKMAPSVIVRSNIILPIPCVCSVSCLFCMFDISKNFVCGKRSKSNDVCVCAGCECVCASTATNANLYANIFVFTSYYLWYIRVCNCSGTRSTPSCICVCAALNSTHFHFICSVSENKSVQKKCTKSNDCVGTRRRRRRQKKTHTQTRTHTACGMHERVRPKVLTSPNFSGLMKNSRPVAINTARAYPKHIHLCPFFSHRRDRPWLFVSMNCCNLSVVKLCNALSTWTVIDASCRKSQCGDDVSRGEWDVIGQSLLLFAISHACMQIPTGEKKSVYMRLPVARKTKRRVPKNYAIKGEVILWRKVF